MNRANITILGRGGFVNGRTELENNTVLLEIALEDPANLDAHYGLHGSVIHSHDRNVVLFTSERIAHFHADEGGSDNDHLALRVSEGGENVLHVRDMAESEDITQVEAG
jgi:hypothetical protein